jgi:hypothetical protein
MITNITKVIPITSLEAGAPQLDFLGRRVPDDACHHYVRHDRRLVLGPASSVNAATNANHPVAPSFSCGPDLKACASHRISHQIRQWTDSPWRTSPRLRLISFFLIHPSDFGRCPLTRAFS